MVVKDPDYKTPLKGIYLIQSDSSIKEDKEDNEYVCVQIVPTNDIFDSGYKAYRNEYFKR